MTLFDPIGTYEREIDATLVEIERRRCAQLAERERIELLRTYWARSTQPLAAREAT